MSKKQNISCFSEELIQTITYIHRFSQTMMKRNPDALFRGDVTFPQYIVLDLLDSEKALKMKDIARALSISLPAATKQVDRLVKLKLVQRTYDKKDRRLVYVSLTLSGKKIVGQTRQARKKMIEQVFGNLTERERTTYLGILRKIRSSLYEKNKKI